ncbi:hypothetical protein MP638_007447 [Amoeboaphelidium occidentale]|nr:hypothetical protein MP638_007447 [Amoeboaphelidium occidentale]
MKSKPAASAETILIWVRYRDDSPVWFTMPVSSNVNDLLDYVILNPYIGFDGYKGPIKIYENERGDKLEPWLKVSSIRSTTWLTPLVVKIPDDCKISVMHV